MVSRDFDLTKYLTRIGLAAPVDCDAAGLERVHRAQAYSVPFENLDIMLGRGIDVDIHAICEKIIGTRRGGYCFELNQLLFAGLQALGFDPRQAVARVHARGEPTGFTHLVMLVEAGGSCWLADVGFGADGLRAPIRYEMNTVSQQDGLAYRLVEVSPWGAMLQRRDGGEWLNLYSFDERLVLPIDLVVGNHFVSTSPRSFFTWMKVATLPNPLGRVSLRDDVLTIERESEKHESRVAPGAPYLAALKRHFGIALGAPYEALKPLNPPPI
jgi:N-hydroxyarylamine O-acetyltransferase